MRRRKGHDGEGHGGDERWLITYADLITLLAAFFIMMYSLSQLDMAKFSRMVGGYKMSSGSAGILPGGPGGNLSGGIGVMEGGRGPEVMPEDARGGGESALDASERKLRALFAATGIVNQTEVRMTTEGLMVSLATPLLFDSGSADMRPDAGSILTAVGQVIARVPESNVRVEGHTDNVPIQTARYPSNWELSSARAATVVRHFITVPSVMGSRFTVVGFGEFRPVAPNSDSEGRARNRRVQIVILRPGAR